MSMEKEEGQSLRKRPNNFNYEILLEQDSLIRLSALLNQYREFMLNMLGNDNLLEHDSFTDMLWSVYHVADELQMRLGENALIEEVISHLTIDMKCAYLAVVRYFPWEVFVLLKTRK